MKAPRKPSPRRSSKSPKDREIDFSDIPETDAGFWADAEIRMPANKKGVYLRIDPEVLDWFKKQGKGYQTRINAVLRRYMEAQFQKSDESPKA